MFFLGFFFFLLLVFFYIAFPHVSRVVHPLRGYRKVAARCVLPGDSCGGSSGLAFLAEGPQTQREFSGQYQAYVALLSKQIP